MALLKVIHTQSTSAPSGQRKYHDDHAFHDVVSYVLNPAKTPQGFIGGYGVNVAHAAFEMELLSQSFGKDKGLRLRHMELSFSPSEAKCFHTRVYHALYKIASYVCQYYADEYQIVFAVHEDTDHPHIHFVMNCVNYRTGLKYRGDKADYYRFQSYVRGFLQEYYGLPLIVVADHG